MTDTQQIRNTIQSEASTYSKQETPNRVELFKKFAWGTAKTFYRVVSGFVTGPIDGLFNAPKKTLHSKYATGGFVIFICALIIMYVDHVFPVFMSYVFIALSLVLMLASALDDDILCKCDKTQ